MTELAPGVRMAGYRLDRVLGRGGMGEVWAATHMTTGERFALKVLKAQLRARPGMKRRLLREARAATAVSHPNIVRVHDVVAADEDTPVIVMDLLEGETLAKRLAREDTLPLAETAALLVPVVSAVHAAHAHGVVHRDLKPDNIFIERTRDGRSAVKVLDFGIAKLTSTDGDAVESGVLTETGSMLGTPCYMAPEQGFGEKDVDHRADVWALGAILYECLSGGRPVEAENVGQFLKRIVDGGITPLERVVPGLPEDVVQLAGRMLEPNRAARLSNLVEVRDVLARFAPADAAAVPLAGTVRRRGRRLQVAVAVLGAAALAVGVRTVAEHGAARAAPMVPVGRAPAVPRPSPARQEPAEPAPVAAPIAAAASPPRETDSAARASARAAPSPVAPATTKLQPVPRRANRLKRVELGSNEAPIIE